MLGWQIRVYRQTGDTLSQPNENSPKGKCLAVWQANSSGLNWLDELVRKGEAIDLGGNHGYPNLYASTAKDLIRKISKKPPGEQNPWLNGVNDILGEGYLGKTVIDRKEIKKCTPDEWLLVEAWDED